MLLLLIYMFLLHFIADFLLQSREMGKKKSTELSYLLNHITIQMFVFLFGLYYVVGPETAAFVALLNGAIHMSIDALIWKFYSLSVWVRRGKWIKENDREINAMVSCVGGIGREPTDIEVKKLMKTNWKYWEDHLFYTTIGFDQFLHISTIVLVWSLL